MCVRVRACMVYVCVCVCMYGVCVCMCAYVYVCMCVCVRACMVCMCGYEVHMYVHTRTLLIHLEKKKTCSGVL